MGSFNIQSHALGNTAAHDGMISKPASDRGMVVQTNGEAQRLAEVNYNTIMEEKQQLREKSHGYL